jgi:hypothetical protein
METRFQQEELLFLMSRHASNPHVCYPCPQIDRSWRVAVRGGNLQVIQLLFKIIFGGSQLLNLGRHRVALALGLLTILRDLIQLGIGGIQLGLKLRQLSALAEKVAIPESAEDTDQKA